MELVKPLLVAAGLRAQAWSRRQRRQRNHLQLWTPFCLLVWTMVYICMAWEYEFWKSAQTAHISSSLEEDIVDTLCSCEGQAGEGVVAFLADDRVRRVSDDSRDRRDLR